MADFVPHALDPRAAHAEVAELRALLDSHAHLKEAVFRDFFRSRPHAAALIGPYTPLVRRIDLLAYEYPLFGDFRCDLAIADSVTRACLLLQENDCLVCGGIPSYPVTLGGAYTGSFPVDVVRIQIPPLGFDHHLPAAVPACPAGFDGMACFRFLNRFAYGNSGDPSRFGLET